MKFYMKQKLFSLKQDFDIYDVNEKPVFRVDSKLISFGRQMKLLDMESGEVICDIKQKVFSLTPTVVVEQEGKEFCRIRKKITFFKPKYWVEGPGWTVDGSILEHHYTIHGSNQPVANIRKKFLSWSDTFELEVLKEDVDMALVIATILAIDLAMDLSQK